MSTLAEKYAALMADLVAERAAATDASWQYRLDEKIADLKRATEEKFGGMSNLRG